MANYKDFETKAKLRDKAIEEKIEVKKRLGLLLDDLDDLFETPQSWETTKSKYNDILNGFTTANSDGVCRKEVSNKIFELRQLLDKRGENICKLLAEDDPMATRHLISKMGKGIVREAISGRIELLSLESGIPQESVIDHINCINSVLDSHSHSLDHLELRVENLENHTDPLMLAHIFESSECLFKIFKKDRSWSSSPDEKKMELLLKDLKELYIDPNKFHAEVIINRARGTSLIKVNCVSSSARWAITNALFKEQPSRGYTVAPINPRVLGPYIRDLEDLAKQNIKDELDRRGQRVNDKDIVAHVKTQYRPSFKILFKIYIHSLDLRFHYDRDIPIENQIPPLRNNRTPPSTHRHRTPLPTGTSTNDGTEDALQHVRNTLGRNKSRGTTLTPPNQTALDHTIQTNPASPLLDNPTALANKEPLNPPPAPLGTTPPSQEAPQNPQLTPTRKQHPQQ